MRNISRYLILLFVYITTHTNAIDIGPDTCGQDRAVLSSWFMEYGLTELVIPPVPPLFEFVAENPYEDPNNPPGNPDIPDGVCAIQWSGVYDIFLGKQKYFMQNFSSEAEAITAGYNVTHQGHCGACSSLQDLGVYMSQNLTDPVRHCGVVGTFNVSREWECLKDLGFSDTCASIWHWNINNTSEDCFQVCANSTLHNEPNNKPDGSLNDCLQCDEDNSGPNFKYFSGRTRRNSGIPSSIIRPPEQVYNMTHCYWYGDLPPAQLQHHPQLPLLNKLLL